MNKKSDWVFIGLLSLCTAFFLRGCNDILLFNPKGPIGDAERFVIIASIALMLIVVIPVFIMVFLFPRKHRASDIKATYMPKWSRSGKIELVIWLVPTIIIPVLGDEQGKVVGLEYLRMELGEPDASDRRRRQSRAIHTFALFLQKSSPVKKILKKNLMHFDRHRKMPVRFTGSVACRHHRPG